MEIRHPWQLFPGQLIQYALDHLHRPSEFDQIVGFLLLDVGIETLLKVFLMLPEEVTKTDMKHKAREAAATGNFHELVQGVETAARTAGDRLSGINLGHVEYFHGLRNKLYHGGNGITVQGEHAEEYASIAVDLLDRLLGVPLKSSFREQALRQARLERLSEQLQSLQTSLSRQMQALERELRMTIEQVEPAFLMPSFEIEVETWNRQGLQFELLSDPRFFDVIATLDSEAQLPQESDSLALSGGGLQVRRFKRDELHKLMPPVLSRFVDDCSVETAAMARLLMSSSLTEFQLIIASIALDFPTTQVINSHNRARVFLESGPPPSLEEHECLEDQVVRMLDEGNLLVGEVQAIRQVIEISAPP